MTLPVPALRWGDPTGPEPRRWPPSRPPVPPFGPPVPDEPVGGWLEERMFGERLVLLHGTVGTTAANRTAATLLTLDALGAEPVRLHVAAGGGELTAVFALM